jgi:hypothetical protein
MRGAVGAEGTFVPAIGTRKTRVLEVLSDANRFVADAEMRLINQIADFTKQQSDRLGEPYAAGVQQFC